jgi:hypothetical protein
MRFSQGVLGGEMKVVDVAKKPVKVLVNSSISTRPSLAAVLRSDPTAHVLGAVDDLGSRHFAAREKPHRVTIDERDVLQIENDSIAGHARQ